MPLDVQDAALLHDMLQSAEIVIEYTTGQTRADLTDNRMLADAVERRIEIIGEAARSLSRAFLDQYSEIPWRAITAARHILAHDYDAVNQDIVWRIVQDHIPPLIRQLTAILADNPPVV